MFPGRGKGTTRKGEIWHTEKEIKTLRKEWPEKSRGPEEVRQIRLKILYKSLGVIGAKLKIEETWGEEERRWIKELEK